MKITEILNFNKKDTAVFTGSGGKTTMLFETARELADSGFKVLVTTTTHIYEPEAGSVHTVIVEKDEEKLLARIREEFSKSRLIAAVSESFIEEETGKKKLKGISAGLAGRMGELQEFDQLLIEADGAKGKSLKGYRDDEPVIPASASKVIIVVGIDALGEPASEETIHRFFLAKDIMNLQEGEEITVEALERLIVNREGYAGRTGRKADAVIINKITDGSLFRSAVALARRLAQYNITEKIILRGEEVPGGILDFAARRT